MHIGMITDSLGALSFDDLLPTAAELGIEQLEFAGGNWSTAPHLALDPLLTARRGARIRGETARPWPLDQRGTARGTRCIRRDCCAIGRSPTRRSRWRG
jgi:hypothetical protein